MKAISVRNVSDDIYLGLQEMAVRNRRSLQEQVKHVLEREVRIVQGAPLAKAGEWRKMLQGRQFLDVVEMIREDRSR